MKPRGIDLRNGVKLLYSDEGQDVEVNIPLTDIQVNPKDASQNGRKITDAATFKAEVHKLAKAGVVTKRLAQNRQEDAQKTQREIENEEAVRVQPLLDGYAVYYHGTGSGVEVIVQPAGHRAPTKDDWPSAEQGGR